MNSPQSQARKLNVANGDFEAFSGPVEIGFPSHFGKWGGNPAEVIEEADGNRVLRFLKTGDVRGGPDDLASNCSVFQLIDLSPLRQQLGMTDPETQVTLNLSARFRREKTPQPIPSSRNLVEVAASTFSMLSLKRLANDGLV